MNAEGGLDVRKQRHGKEREDVLNERESEDQEPYSSE